MTTDPGHGAGEPSDRVPSSNSIGGLGAIESLVLAVVAVYPIAAIQRFAFSTVPRLALISLLAPLGLVALAHLVRRRVTASYALVAVVLSATVSAALAEAPRQAMFGNIVSWMSVVLFLAAGGWWAIGRQLSDRARWAIPRLLLPGAALNLVVGLAQISLNVREGVLATFSGRAAGLLDNPAYFGSFMAGLAGWWVVESVRTRHWQPIAVVPLLAFATGLSGSRAALVAVMVVASAALAIRRDRRAIESWSLTVAGFVLSTGFTNVVSTRGTIDRLATGESGRERFAVWRLALEATIDRPLFGWGFDHVDQAIGVKMAPDFVARFRYDDLQQPWIDPHNMVVMLMVSLGVVGLVLVLGFAVLALRGDIDVAFLAASGAIAATWMLQPASVETLPLALLFLGLAVRPTSQQSADSLTDLIAHGRTRIAAVGALCLGVCLATYLLSTTFLLQAAARSDDVEAVADRASWFYEDPYVAAYVARQFDGAGRRASSEVEARRYIEESVVWSRRAAEITNEARRWNRVAEQQLLLGDTDSALVSLDVALAEHPWNPSTHKLRLLAALGSEDTDLLETALADACRMELEACDAEVYADALP